MNPEVLEVAGSGEAGGGAAGVVTAERTGLEIVSGGGLGLGGCAS